MQRGMVFFTMIVMGVIACSAPGLVTQTAVPTAAIVAPTLAATDPATVEPSPAAPTPTPEPTSEPDTDSGQEVVQVITRILPPDTIGVSQSAGGGGSGETTVILTDQTALTYIDGSPMAFDALFFGARVTVTGATDGTQVRADEVVVDAAPMDAPLTDSYVDEEFGYALEIPANWYISDRISNPPPDRLTRTISSFFPAGPGPTPENQFMIRIEVVDTGGADIDTWVAEEEAALAGVPAVPVFDEWRDLPGGLRAYRVQRRWDAEQMEWAYLYAVVNGRGVLLVGTGDTARFDDIANTLAEVPSD